MPITPCRCASHLRVSVAALISYVLVTLTCLPLSTPARARSKSRAAMLLQQAPAPHREGELLIRFRNGVSDRDKAALIAAHGARIKKDLARHKHLGLSP
jgi:hypothetical protein